MLPSEQMALFLATDVPENVLPRHGFQLYRAFGLNCFIHGNRSVAAEMRGVHKR